EDDHLGIVYPDDPHLMGWTENKPAADKLALRLDMNNLPDGNFSFPIGNMFWVRPKAIQPLFDLKFTWDSYPVEPLPGDGTLLHALERISPLVVEKLGYKRLVTYIPGIGR
ncbi:MAG: glycosyl transferase, group 1, partial [uncultured bacterium]